MSKLSDALKFDAFQFKDMWKQIKKDPERLLFGMGTLDPLSTKLTNKVFNKDYEPLTDISGGPYGGHVSSLFSGKDGGVYKRAQDAGLDTKSRGQVSDIGSSVGLLFGAGMGAGALGGGAAAGGGSGAAVGGGGGLGAGVAPAAGGGSGVASAATLPEVVVTGSHIGGSAVPAITGGPAVAAGASSGSNGFNWQKMLKQGGQQGQQQQGSTYQPVDLSTMETDPSFLQANPMQEAQLKKYLVHALRSRNG